MELLDEFDRYLEYLSEGLAHADRRAGLKGYCTGLLLSARQSVEPMAARIDPGNASARHQALHHFVAKAKWSDEAVLRRVRDRLVPLMDGTGDWHWIVDETWVPKKGRHSVGVARQPRGEWGRQENCQVAVRLSLATPQASLPIACRLYLPAEWAADAERRARAQVPDGIGYQTKTQIALHQIRAAIAEGLPRGIVLAGAGHGGEAWFRQALRQAGLPYVAGVPPETMVWPLAQDEPAPDAPGDPVAAQPPQRPTPECGAWTAKALAACLWPHGYGRVDWQPDGVAVVASRFAAIRVCTGDPGLVRGGGEAHAEWLLIEWPEGRAQPSGYFLCMAPAGEAGEPPQALARAARMRWRIECDGRELELECGFGRYEGRGWIGFHHHATLSIATHAFLVQERLRTGRNLHRDAFESRLPPVPGKPRARGSPRSGTPGQAAGAGAADADPLSRASRRR